jgi:hypothetical protein
MGLLETTGNNHERSYWLQMVSCTIRGCTCIVRMTQQPWKAFKPTRQHSNALSRPRGYLFPSPSHFVCLCSILIFSSTTLLPSFPQKNAMGKTLYSEAFMFFKFTMSWPFKTSHAISIFSSKSLGLQCF